jgi:putative two-component system response regulator
MLINTSQKDYFVLVVDDEPAIRKLLKQVLDMNGYLVSMAGNVVEARAELAKQKYHLVLSDINMPGESGFQLLSSIRKEYPNTAVVMVSAIDDPNIAEQALEMGVYGYITKPFKLNEVLINTANALRRRHLEIAARNYQARLEREVAARTKELQQTLDRLRETYQQLEQASLETVVRLARAGEYKDQDTGAHILRMGHFASALARKIGLREKTVDNILYAAPMHDIGKIGIPDDILLKPGPLNEEEWVFMRTHTSIGADILSGAEKGFIRLAEVIAQTHHEKWDGSGYPHGLKGDEIPIAGQITAVTDVYDALTSVRPYKKAFSLEKTREIMEESKGKHFRPDLVDAFFEIQSEVREIAATYQDTMPAFELRTEMLG